MEVGFCLGCLFVILYFFGVCNLLKMYFLLLGWLWELLNFKNKSCSYVKC